MKKEFKSKKTINDMLFKNYKVECINCKKCVKICPFLNKYVSSPKEFLNNLDTNSIDINLPYYCSLCGCCKRVCPKDIDLGKVFFSLREEITTLNNGKPPIKAFKTMDFHQNFSNTTMFKGVLKNKDTKVFFMPGCSLNAYNPELTLKTYNYLKLKFENIGIIFNCCNKPTRDLGERDLFNSRFKTFIDSLGNGNIEIITACQSCFAVFKTEAPNIKVTSLWALLKELGVPNESKNKGVNCKLNFSIKDSCQSLDFKEIQDGIRYIVSELGYTLNDDKVSNSCCGLGGFVHLSNPKLSNDIRNNSLSKLTSDNIISYCGGCLASVNNSDKNSYHILELVFDNEDTLFKNRSINISTLSSWKNRYKVKKIIVKDGYKIE
ncbi:MAG: heterodisulfide reductase-related iron-sulfur binding cluster [Clostridium sp.]